MRTVEYRKEHAHVIMNRPMVNAIDLEFVERFHACLDSRLAPRDAAAFDKSSTSSGRSSPIGQYRIRLPLPAPPAGLDGNA